MILYPLPTTITVDGAEYEIQTNFRNWILFEELLADEEVPQHFKFWKLLELVCKEIPSNPKATFDALFEFYTLNKKPNGEMGSGGDIAYSFSEDSNLIFTAFLKTYGIDLEVVEHLHWWKFRAMFNDLNEDCMLVRIMEYRTKEIEKIKNKEEREFYKEMKKRYTLKKPTVLDVEVASELFEALENGGDVGKIVERIKHG